MYGIKGVKGAEAEKDLILHVLSDGCHALKPSKEQVEFIEMAAKNLQTSLKYVLPKGAKVKINNLGEGVFGNGYKLEITDASGNKIIHDRVLKVFKDSGIAAEIESAKVEKLKELLSKYSDDDIIAYFKTKVKQLSPDEETIFLDAMKTFRANTDKMSGELNAKNLLNFTQRNADVHGLYAEANSVTRLKYILGHDISRTSAVNTDMFDLEKGYSLAQFSDDTLPKVTSLLDFKRLGLHAGDLHRGNLVNGRIVDFGAITTTNKELTDKTVLKYFKRIMNRNNAEERAELIMRYKKLAQDPKTPFRNKIQQAVDLAENKGVERTEGLLRFKHFEPPKMKSLGQINAEFKLKHIKPLKLKGIGQSLKMPVKKKFDFNDPKFKEFQINAKKCVNMNKFKEAPQAKEIFQLKDIDIKKKLVDFRKIDFELFKKIQPLNNKVLQNL